MVVFMRFNNIKTHFLIDVYYCPLSMNSHGNLLKGMNVWTLNYCQGTIYVGIDEFQTDYVDVIKYYFTLFLVYHTQFLCHNMKKSEKFSITVDIILKNLKCPNEYLLWFVVHGNSYHTKCIHTISHMSRSKTCY